MMNKKYKYIVHVESKHPSLIREYVEKVIPFGYLPYNKEKEANKCAKTYMTGEYSYFDNDCCKDDAPNNYNFNIDNKWEYEAALAIAAIRDDNKPYVGEWVVSNKDYYTLKERALWKISEVIQRNPISFRVEDYKCDNKNGTSDLGYHPKATPEEIIAYMKEKYAKIELPAKWCIKGQEARKYSDLKEWYYNTVSNVSSSRSFINDGYYHFPKYGDTQIFNRRMVLGYVEITYDQWKQWYDQQQKEEVETIKPTIMTKKLESFSIKGPINQYPDLFEFLNNCPNRTAYGKCKFIGDTSENYHYNASTGESYSKSCSNDFKLITYKEWKEMIEGTTDKKVIGYKLIKEYPSKPVALGVMITSGWSDNNCANFPEFWEVCYEVEKKEITLRIECDEPFSVVVRKGESTIVCPENNMNIEILKRLRASFSYKLNSWDFSINSVNIGCKKNIPFKYLDEIITAWDSLNK